VDKNNQNNKNSGLGCLILVLILVAFIFVPLIVIPISQNIENSNKEKHIEQLTKEGKVKSSNDILNEIIEIFKNKDEEKLREYLSDDFLYYDENNIEHKYASDFFMSLQFLMSYEIEKRDNSIQDEETYRIYWNTVEQNIKNGIIKGEYGYCLQTITIVLKKVVKQDVITYEIERIMLKDV